MSDFYKYKFEKTSSLVRQPPTHSYWNPLETIEEDTSTDFKIKVKEEIGRIEDISQVNIIALKKPKVKFTVGEEGEDEMPEVTLQIPMQQINEIHESEHKNEQEHGHIGLIVVVFGIFAIGSILSWIAFK